MRKKVKHRKYPDLGEGVRIQYRDKNGATRAGKILWRKGNVLTVIIGTKYKPGLNKKYRINVDDVFGYWKGRVAAKHENMMSLPIKTRRG